MGHRDLPLFAEATEINFSEIEPISFSTKLEMIRNKNPQRFPFGGWKV
jgi:hypothetical protein